MGARPGGDPLLVYKYSEYQNKGVTVVKTHVETQNSQHKFAHTHTTVAYMEEVSPPTPHPGQAIFRRKNSYLMEA